MFQNPYRIYRYSLFLVCLAFGIGMVYLNVWILGELEFPFLDIQMVFVYAFAPYFLLSYLKIPSNLLEKQVSFEVKKISFTDEEKEQMKRKSDFHNDSLTEYDKQIKDNEWNELRANHEKLVESRETYPSKKPSEMNNFEYYHYLSNKISKISVFGKLFAVIVSMVFPTLYFQLGVSVPYFIGLPLALLLLFIGIVISIYGRVTLKKFKNVDKKITPKVFNDFLNKFGINSDD